MVMPKIIPMPLKDGDSLRKWQMDGDWYYTVRFPSGMEIEIFIRDGFIFDGASIPRLFRNIYSPTGYLLIAAILHDYQYQWGYMVIRIAGKLFTRTVSREYSDKMLRLVANIEHPSRKKATYVAYKFLRTGGWVAWNRHRRRDKEK